MLKKERELSILKAAKKFKFILIIQKYNWYKLQNTGDGQVWALKAEIEKSHVKI